MSSAPGDAPRVLCVGFSCVDYAWRVEGFPPTGSRTRATAFRQQGGGPAATAAVAVAALGGHAELWALHGDDPAGEAARAELEEWGVRTGSVPHQSGATTATSAVLIGPTGERWIFPYRGERLEDDPSLFPLPEVATFDAVLVDFRHPMICRAAVHAARDAGVPTIADASNAETWRQAREVDYLIASEECAREVAADAVLPSLHADSTDGALEALAHHDRQVVGVTLGAEGFHYRGPSGSRHISALPVDVVDTTGAGDVFHGAYAFGVAQGWNLERCGLFASVAAAVSCTGIGREAIPGVGEVEHLLETKTLREMDELRWT